MAVIYVCDGCGKQEPGSFNDDGRSFKPHLWFSRTDKDGTQLACTRVCIETVAKKTGKTDLVLPI